MTTPALTTGTPFRVLDALRICTADEGIPDVSFWFLNRCEIAHAFAVDVLQDIDALCDRLRLLCHETGGKR